VQLKMGQHEHGGHPVRHRNGSRAALASTGYNDDLAVPEMPRKEYFAQFVSELRKEMQAARAEEARLLQADKAHISGGGSLRKTPSGTDYILWGRIGTGGVPDLLNRIDDDIERCREPVIITGTAFSTRYRFSRWLLRNGHIARADLGEDGLVVAKSA
jgi:hypothetical protein